ncbi:hypothetical protein PZ938_15815 [Luteipulveratus sp. YIM 133132]|uniref:hypothetical protein n=1 Tax=Luteipulveratus flavus TaxID=3031728 RepID=UPI0023B02B1B|nr:hypothetical protein [Luteipulveratus sp. YIM 133132]MDE9367084.1 hypothetical protein [Luteipulveratus sp. YIM 133132]
MLRTTIARTAAAGLLLATPLALTGCGRFGGDDPTPVPPGSAAPTADPTAPSTGSTPPPSSSTPGTTDDAAGRPSREAVTSGVRTAYGSSPAAAVLDVDKLASCVTNDIYDTVSAPTLQALADGKPSNIRNPQDVRTVAQAVGDCTPKAKRNVPSLPTDIPTTLPSLPTQIPGM